MNVYDIIGRELDYQKGRVFYNSIYGTSVQTGKISTRAFLVELNFNSISNFSKLNNFTNPNRYAMMVAWILG